MIFIDLFIITRTERARQGCQGAVGLVKLGTGIILTKIQQSNLVGHAVVRHHRLGAQLPELPREAALRNSEPSHVCHFGDLPGRAPKWKVKDQRSNINEHHGSHQLP